MTTSTTIVRAVRCGLLATATLAAGAASAQSWQANCIRTGGVAPEPLGREGHALSISTGTCTIAGGPMDGAVETHRVVWEVDRNDFKLVANEAIIRKPGMAAVAVTTAATGQITTQEGRPVWSATGNSQVNLATGPAAPLAGKKYTWTARFTGPATYVIDVKTVD